MTRRRGCARPVRILVAALCAGLLAAPADAQSRDRLAASARRADARIRALQREADALASEERGVLGDLRRLEVDRQLKAEELSAIEADLKRTTRELSDTARRVAELERRAGTARPGVEARLVALYKLGRPGYLRLLLDVDDLGAVARAYRIVAMLAARGRRQVDAFGETLAALHATQAALEARRDRVVSRPVAAQAKRVDAIDARRDLTARLTGELQLAQGRLQAALEALAAGGPADPDPGGLPIRPFQGELAWPVHPPGTRPGRRLTTAVRNGLELPAPAGSQVAAIHGGHVAFAGTFTGFDHLVIIDHGTTAYSLYGYLSSIDVERGRAVGSGQVIGTVGRSPTGREALYFELRIDGEPVNPLEWLKP